MPIILHYSLLIYNKNKFCSQIEFASLGGKRITCTDFEQKMIGENDSQRSLQNVLIHIKIKSRISKPIC
ncbi:hypothetical protein BSG8_12220 [Bacillus subtilis subsp. natto]|nr:hypothetical protein BSG8_12220 [Bacillus subtilis subsp. natto]BEH05242.1 hypothetical protein BSNN_12750 [Bacillus subtilis subsp. natto]